MPLIYLALGTNLGDREANLAAARSRLGERVRVERASPIYETEPWGIADQPWFLNQVLEGRTELAPAALLRFCKGVELAMGREAVVRYGPRLIDIDILFYDKLVLHSYNLSIPHPRLPERAFVLAPLADLAPDLVHPQWGLTVRELAARNSSTAIQRLV